MEKRWLDNYPPGVPAQIDFNGYHSIVDVLEKSCNQYSERMAYHNMGAELSYAELDYLTRNFAAAESGHACCKKPSNILTPSASEP